MGRRLHYMPLSLKRQPPITIQPGRTSGLSFVSIPLALLALISQTRSLPFRHSGHGTSEELSAALGSLWAGVRQLRQGKMQMHTTRGQQRMRPVPPSCQRMPAC